ncbi:Phenylacetaldehyde dehydrogenase [Rubrobacter xylanophilus DSM 9941]|uniref:aldehyde dehydrogenase family protein n=1 Tax=Rubrobacter xylanophilus TaxID=49319 RepID=UPI001C640C7F|nr:aldehyde dehydrogenase family protein [Rubrobacter xylanophilus]QYJ15703.1 Phenylacetaldehyde dehydrogenase [Rubrobacter xylanophilus DSM 9941]
MDLQRVEPGVNDFIRKEHRLLIGGEWVEAASGRTFETINPATEEHLADVAWGEAEDIDRAVRAARRAFADGSPWRRMSPSDRGRIIYRISELIEEHADEFAMLETLDNGKPFAVAKAADVALAADLFRYMAGWPTKIEGNTIPVSAVVTGGEFLGMTLKEPVGVVGQIIPWNFPLLMAAWKLGPVLAAGCTVVLKPAEQTPLSALRLGELLLEAGLPDGVVNIVTGFGDAGAALAAHDDVDKVAFTGSTEVGKLIVKAAAGNLKKVTLELGGKSPNVVFKDADLEVAIPGAANGIFFNHGQCCNAGSRLFVEREVYDEVVEGVAERARSIRLGSGLDPETEMGPLISDEQFEKVLGYIEQGREAGAETYVGGGRVGSRGYFVEPTILTNTSPEMSVVREEIFGPVVAAIPFSDPEELVAEANDTRYGLAAGVFTRDISKAYRTAKRLRAGTVWINCYHVFDAALPFGGYKESGWGREMGHDVLENYLETKTVVTAL